MRRGEKGIRNKIITATTPGVQMLLRAGIAAAFLWCELLAL
jgi:hypothetical protein